MQANLKWWEKLPQDQRDVILKAGKDAEAWIRGAIAQSEDEAEEGDPKAGLQIYHVTPGIARFSSRPPLPPARPSPRRAGPCQEAHVELAE